MDAQKYLMDLLQGASEYALTDHDLNIVDRKGLPSYIKAKLFSKKYRKWSLDEQCILNVEREIDDAIEKDRPIDVFFAQGSYKLWRVSSAPRSNWAEFFNLAYLISYLSPIVSAYKRGVSLTYYMLTVLPQVHNNLSESEVVAYLESFQSLINQFAKHIPGNMVVKIERDLDAYSRKKYNIALKNALVLADKHFYEWPKTKQEDYVRRARLNIKWDGVEDWTKLSEKEQTTKVEKAVLYEYAATQVILEKDKERRGIILSTLPKEDGIGLGSTSTSIAKHWVGEGVLEESNGNLYPRIFSPSQYEYARQLKHASVKVDVVAGDIFSKIDVFPKHFDFS